MKCIFSAALAVTLLAGLCGCGENIGENVVEGETTVSARSTAPDSTVPTDSAAPADISTPTPTDVATPETTASEPIVEEEDPYDVLKVNEDFRNYFTSNKGHIYLLRDKNYYSLGASINAEKAEEYQVGLRSTVKYIAAMYNYNGSICRALGNIPVITVEADDLIIGEGLSTMSLTPATLAGYSISMIKSDDPPISYTFFLSFKEQVTIFNIRDIKQFEMTDSQGNAAPQILGYKEGGNSYYIPDFDNLIKDETYTVSWFEGTTYHEYTLKADSPYYKVNRVNGPDTYNLEGELHKEGYASFDLSDVPPGLYYTNKGGLICITE